MTMWGAIAFIGMLAANFYVGPVLLEEHLERKADRRYYIFANGIPFAMLIPGLPSFLYLAIIGLWLSCAVVAFCYYRARSRTRTRK